MTTTPHTRRPGFTLTEVLVVVSIVVLLTALSIPTILQMGLFASNRTQNAAREYFEMIRAARLYATTYNVETALVYQGRLVFETGNDEPDANGFPGNPVDMVPIIDAYAVCRRLTREEILQINADFLDPLGNQIPETADVFVPVPESNGQFRPLPGNTCILPDIFEVDADDLTRTALSAVYVVDPAFVLPSVDDREDLTGYMNPLEDPRNPGTYFHFEQGDTIGVQLADPPADPATVYAFPAHRFAPSGEIIPLQTVQRFRVRVGMLPDMHPTDRFVTHTDALVLDPGEDPKDIEQLEVLFHNSAGNPGTVEQVPRYHDPRREKDIGNDNFEERAFLENSVTLNIYTATGRVEILPTKSPENLDNT